MVKKNIFKSLYILFFILFLSCNHNKVKPNNIINKDSSDITIQELEKKIDYLVIDKDINDSIIFFLKSNNLYYANEVQILIDRISDLENKILILDSINYSMHKSLLFVEDNITLLSKSYNEIAQLTHEDNIKDYPPINDYEFKERYIESLGAYQNGDWDKSLEGFNYLLTLGSNISLLDNCQYWVGEIYYKLKEYHLSIKEFKKVLLYSESNKKDDSLYKIAKCYSQLGNSYDADMILKDLIKSYPNSEYVRKAKELLN